MPAAASVRRQIASGARPMPPPTRIAPAASGFSSRGGENGRPRGPVSSSPSPCCEPGEGRGSRADRLEQEGEAHPALGRLGRLGHGERPRQEGAFPSPAPAALGGEHVELPGRRHRALAVEDGDDPVAAGGGVGGDLRAALAERREHATVGRCRLLAHLPSAAAWTAFSAASACSSCRLMTSPPPRLSTPMARAAAEAPVIVVMHGMPRRVAALRIS